LAQIAHALGANVIGVDRHQPGPQTPAAAVIDDFITFDPGADVGAAIKRSTGGRGADVVYNAVGGVTTPSALAALAHRGRLVVISAVGSPTVTVNLLDLYHNETRIFGTDSTKLTVVDSLGAFSRWRPTSSPGSFGHFPSPPRTRSTTRPRHTRPSPTTPPAAS
jgi:NADPH:quinone reductase-like Zn-dependent oxidoreductase